MNDQDKEILELYLKDIKRKKIFFLIIAIFFVVNFFFYGFFINYKQSLNDTDNLTQKETEINIINKNTIDEEVTSNIENTVDDKSINNESEVNEISKEESKSETKVKIDEKDTNVSSKNKEKNAKDKPMNKDFLFTDGYTMDNVTRVAQDYLKKSGFAGECIPLKDNEGVYIGMRVVFH